MLANARARSSRSFTPSSHRCGCGVQVVSSPHPRRRDVLRCQLGRSPSPTPPPCPLLPSHASQPPASLVAESLDLYFLTWSTLETGQYKNSLCLEAAGTFMRPRRSGGEIKRRFYTIILLPPLVGILFTRNGSQGIYCRCNLRCRTTSFNQQFLCPWSNIAYLPCIFDFFFGINACQSLSTRGAHPTIERSIRFLTSFWSLKLIRSQGTSHKAKEKLRE